MLKIPTNTKELEEGVNDFTRDVKVGVQKNVTEVAKDVSNQASLTDFVKEMYAPSAKGTEGGSGETASVAEQLTPKPGEMLGNIAGSPLEPGQQIQGESVLSQISVPVDQLAGAMIGSPMEPGESAPSEDPFEQLLPSANQLMGHATGSVPAQKTTPHMETASQQIIPTVDELTSMVGITPAEAPAIPGQRQAPPVEHAPTSTPSGGAEQNPAAAAQGQPPEVPGTMQSPASQEQMIQQQQQQQEAMQHPASQQAELNQAGIDPAMQMSLQERTTLSPEQKAQREQHMLHERTYFHGKQFDPIATLQERVEEERKKREQEEEQKKQEEEEEKQRQKEEEEKQKQEELPEPNSKPKPGAVDVDRKKKQAETHRGASG
jgi:hypothetical protein